MAGMFGKSRDRRREGQETLRRAIDQWHAAGNDGESLRLSDGCRERILAQGLRSGAASSPMAVLFPNTGRLALAAALPALLLALALGYWAQSVPGRNAETRLRVAKQGGDVVILIANGHTTHAVSKSNLPNGLGTSEQFQTASGIFRDRIESGSDLVYYRID